MVYLLSFKSVEVPGDNLMPVSIVESTVSLLMKTIKPENGNSLIISLFPFEIIKSKKLEIVAPLPIVFKGISVPFQLFPLLNLKHCP